MCLESLGNLGARLFVSHRLNYQDDLETGAVLLPRRTAMFAKYIDELIRPCIQYVAYHIQL